MNASEIKLELFRKLDALKESRLEEIYGTLINLINSKIEINEWDSLTIEQQKAIHMGIEQLDKGEGRDHKNVISDFRKRYLD